MEDFMEHERTEEQRIRAKIGYLRPLIIELIALVDVADEVPLDVLQQLRAHARDSERFVQLAIKLGQSQGEAHELALLDELTSELSYLQLDIQATLRDQVEFGERLRKIGADYPDDIRYEIGPATKAYHNAIPQMAHGLEEFPIKDPTALTAAPIYMAAAAKEILDDPVNVGRSGGLRLWLAGLLGPSRTTKASQGSEDE
jgi:hypothetical protein